MKKVNRYKNLFYCLMILNIWLFNCNYLFGLDVTILNNPAPGYINFSAGIDNLKAIALYDNYGEPHYNESPFPAGMQKVLSDGYWYVFSHTSTKIFQLDANLSITDSITLPQFDDSIFIDNHDFLLMPNGYYLIAMTHVTKMDLSQIIEGGHEDARIMGVRLLQIDKAGNIHWSWDCFDYLDITEATRDMDLTQALIDLTHFNALAIDTDGNILVSLRNIDQVIKIDKNTSDIIWRLGGSASRMNDFTFINDDQNGFNGFSHQHSINILPNGNLLLFDNGNLKSTQYSRAVEYELDQTNHIARKVWEYRKSPDVFAGNMGSVQRLENGNTFVNWSFGSVQEIKPNGTIALEVSFEAMYRIVKLTLNMKTLMLRITNNGLYSFNETNNYTDIKLDINSKNGTGLTWVEKHNYSPPVSSFGQIDFSSILNYRWVVTSDSVTNASGKIIINTENLNGINNPNKVTIYKRNKEATGNFLSLNTTYNPATKELSADFSNFGEFIICSNVLSEPYLLEPLHNAIGIQPNSYLIWNKLIGATSYKLQIASDNSFNQIVKNINTNDTTLSFNDLLNDKLYYWRVCGMNSKDTSQWSTVRNFKTKIVSPILLFPSNYKYSVRLTDSLIWENTIPNTKYWLQLAKDSTFNNILENKTDLTIGFFVLNLKENNQTFFWRVQAARDNDTSNWSKHYSFTTRMEKPSLYSPTKDSLNLPVELKLQWILVSGASHYNVVISNDSNFSVENTQKYFIDKNQIVLNKLLYSKDYYWKVQAVRSTDSSDFSDVYKFSTLLTKPNLLKPLNNSVDLLPDYKFTWENQNNADFYYIQISTDSLFEEIVQDIKNLDTNFYSTNDLPEFSKLYWRIKYKIGFKISEWSDIWSFATAKGPNLQVPVLINPKDLSKNQQIKGTFDWGTVLNAKYYKIQISKDPEFKKVFIDSSNILVNSYKYSNFDYSTTYYWRVKAYRTYDSSEWSGIWHLETLSKPSIGALTLVKPRFDALQVSVNDSLIWMKNNNAVKYQLQVSSDSAFSFLTISEENLVLHFYRYNNLEKNRTYFWRVRYITANDTSSWSAVWEFMTETNEHLFAPTLLKPVNYIFKVPVDGNLEWEAVESATSYRIGLSKSETFFPRVMNVSWHKDLKLNYSNLENNTLYFWRVAGQNDNSVSPWSAIKQFVTELKPIEFVTPVSGFDEMTTSGYLRWERIDGAESYQILLSDNEDFDNILIENTVFDTLMQFNLGDENQYYWKIKALNTNNESSWSEIFTFTIPKSSGVSDFNDAGLIIYPNPANTSIQILFGETSYQNIRIINNLGEIEYLCDITKNELFSKVIDINHLSSGIYFVVLKRNDFYLTKKLIIFK